MSEIKSLIEQEQMDREVGFRPLLTRAPFVEELVASPSEYDAAPTYLTREYLAQTQHIRRAVLEHQMSTERVQQGSDSMRRQVGIALEMVAPIGFAIVRAQALVRTASYYLFAAGNPVIALVSAPALFLTGKQMLTDLRRAFVTDPKVRELSQRATRRIDAEDFRGAALLLKEALEQDINPDYRRNGDLYLQLGLAQIRDGRPRQAMVAFARASVLFREGDGYQLHHNGRKVEVSKRGLAELLAVSSIDSFASTDSGLDEWSELLGDFAQSAMKRLESFSATKDRGHLFGLFGVDAEAAELGRELMAKVVFLSAKMKIRSLANSVSTNSFLSLLDEGLAELDAASLSSEEHLTALLEQAQFYASNATASGHASVRAQATLRLLGRAAELADGTDPKMAARIRAEAIAFLLEVAPEVAGSQADAVSLNRALLPMIDALERQIETGLLEELPMVSLLQGWLPEKRYLLSEEPETRQQAIRSSVLGYQRADEPVASMHSALRLAYCATSPEDKEEALRLLFEVAKELLSAPKDPISMAFAGKYLLDAAGAAEDVGDLDRLQSAENFLQAAKWVRAERGYVALYVHGKPVIHPWRVAELVLRGQAAAELARGGREVKALAILESLKYQLDDAPLRVKQAVELERAVYLLEGGQQEVAVQLLEKIEQESRERGDLGVQRRSLQLLAAAQRTGAGLARAAGLQRGEPPSPEPRKLISTEKELQHDGSGTAGGGIVGAYSTARTQFLELAADVLRILDLPELRPRLERASPPLAERVRGRVERIEQNLFRIAIVGEFSSGKSTLLNAIMGASILPSSIRPTTSVVNVLAYGNEPMLRIHYESGDEEQGALSSLKDYVTERRNPGNKRGVAQVRIESPVDLLRDGVELVDTPGLQSLIEAHTRVTYGLIPTCDAVVLIAAARQPFSESLGSFLDSLHGFVDNKVFYVLNKIDQLEVEGARKAKAFAVDRVADHVEGARVFGISAYRALAARRLASGEASVEDYEDDPRLGTLVAPERLLADSELPELEASLGEFLSRTRGLPLLTEQALSLSEILFEVEGLLATERRAVSLSLQELHDAHQRLAKEHAKRRTDAERILGDLETNLREELERARARMLDELDRAASVAGRHVIVTAETIASDEAIARLQESIRAVVRAEATQVVRVAQDEIRDVVARHRLRARQELRRLQSDLQAEFRETLGLDVDDALGSVGVNPVHVEADGWGVIAGNVAMGGVLGFVGSLLLGPIGIGLAIFGGSFLEAWMRDKRVKAVQSGVDDAIGQAFSTIHKQLSTATQQLIDEVAEEQIREMGVRRDEIINQFDLQLNALADRAQMEREDKDEHDRKVRTIQARTAGIRQEIRIFVRQKELI